MAYYIKTTKAKARALVRADPELEMLLVVHPAAKLIEARQYIVDRVHEGAEGLDIADIIELIDILQIQQF